MKIRPLHDRLIVKRLEEERKTASGIVIPDTAAEKPDQGEVKAIGKGKVLEDGKIRPVDLYVTTGHRRAGVVLVGDAFATSCPAAGTGCNKVFTDVERLCHEHIPRWLADAGMGAEKIAAFYDDEVKVDCDAACLAKAYFLRALSTETGMAWQARRWSRFIVRLGVGSMRRAHGRLRRLDIFPKHDVVAKRIWIRSPLRQVEMNNDDAFKFRFRRDIRDEIDRFSCVIPLSQFLEKRIACLIAAERSDQPDR